ncbi:MAG: aminotransferase class V-fold PLP-dependent enzyme [Thermoplasmata archaeon]
MLPELHNDFPVLKRRFRGKRIIYLDSACMSLKPRQVLDAIMDYYQNFPACGGRSVHRLSLEVGEKVEEARKKIAEFLGARQSEIVFTKNATEGINLVANALNFRKGDCVLTTDKEHNSNLVPWLLLKKRKGIRHLVVRGKKDNTFNLDGYAEILEKEDVKLVSVVHTSNLDGVTNPAEEIVARAHKHGALVLLDAAQSAPHRKLNLKEIGADFAVCSMHKMLGPTGVGILYVNSEHFEKLEPFIGGGETVVNTTYRDVEFLPPPARFEAGLQNYSGIIGSKAAIEYLENVGMEKVESHEIELNRIVSEELLKFEEIEIIGPEEPALRGGIFSFNIKGWNPHDVGILLDEAENIMVRTGRLCVHSWFNAKGLEGCIRASFYLYNTEEDARKFAETVRGIVRGDWQ